MNEHWQEISDELSLTKQGYSPDLNHEQVMSLLALVKWYGPIRSTLTVIESEPALTRGTRDLVARCLKGAP
jgi:hypothetical protein